MFYTDCQLSNDERALLSYPDSDCGPEFEVRHNNASVRSACPICMTAFKPRIGDVLFFGDDPVCDDCDTLPLAQAEANAQRMAFARKHIADLLGAADALFFLREKYMQMACEGRIAEGAFIAEAQGVLAGDVVSNLMERLASGENAPDDGNSPGHRTRILEGLKADGLTVGECIRALAVPNDDPYVKKARDLVAGDDDIEIDDATTTSVGEDGAWVLSWLWVSNEDAGVTSKVDL